MVTAQSTLTASYVRPIDYREQHDLLEATRQHFEKFRDLIDHTPRLPAEITLSHELLRVKVNMALGQINNVNLCIEVIGAPCADIEQKFKTLLDTLDDLVRDCKMEY